MVHTPSPSRIFSPRPLRSRFTRGRFFAALVLMGLCALGYSAFGLTLSQRPGLVTEVADGDTLVVLSEKGAPIRVRLFGIDAPEYHQTGGREAAAFARNMLLGKQVTLATVDEDKYGRAVAVIHLPDGTNVNKAMVGAGHAWVYRQFCKEYFCAAWIYQEYQARQQRHGLWREQNPQEPWEWRRHHPRP